MNQIKLLLMSALAVCTISASAQWSQVEWAEDHGLTMPDFVNDEVGYAYMHQLFGFYSGLGKTEDGGQTWTDVPLPLPGSEFQAVDFYAEGEGVIVIRDWGSTDAITQIYHTLDDGETWENISPTTTETGFGIAAIQFFDAATGCFVTENSYYATSDGGDNWTETVLPISAISLSFSDVDHGIIGTWDASFNYFGGMLCTEDGGLTWNELLLDINNTVMGEVHQFNETTAYAAPVKWGAYDQHEFYKTTDNGLNWTSVPLPETDDDAYLSGFDFWDENYGVVTLKAPEEFYIYETIDGGESWELQNELGTFYIEDITLTENSGYIVGGKGLIYRLDAPLAVSNPEDVAVTLYPNPARSGQNIQWESPVDFTEIRIIDITGKTVFQENLITQKSIIPNLNRGVYFVSLQNDKTSKTVKIMVD